MKLLAISDLHVGFEKNRAAVDAMTARPDDWLILAGDVGETVEHLEWTLDTLGPRFRQLVWCPGNHELWTIGDRDARGQEKYERLVEVCRKRGVLTPEDDYAVFDGGSIPYLVAPMFVLYDYTFRPDHVLPENAVAWARQAGVRCVDEDLLHPEPYGSRVAWCHARCAWTEDRLLRTLRATPHKTVLVNHFPLKQSLAQLPAIPRFQPWCGTRRTEDWHLRFNAAVVVTGHLHIRKTSFVDGCRFEEVSLGYPERQWRGSRGADPYVREILPGEASGSERAS